MEPVVGSQLGSYRILSLLGTGGMGKVFRAYDDRLQRDVALKILLAASFDDEAARTRLLREARAAAALNHPHICTVHEVGESNGQPYIAMEFVNGQPLSDCVRGQSLPVEKVLSYGEQIADALAHAHERHIVHRDLKSGNVVVMPEGRVKVLDFGLAKRLGPEDLSEATTRSQVSLTEPGALAGTVAYMAPEQLRGQPATVRSDIWALGVLLYEMATGMRPFQGNTGYELISAILNEKPSPPPSIVPVELRMVIEKCLAKDPAQRYQHAGEVRAALEAVRSGAVVPWVAWRYRLARRRKALLAVAALGLVAAVGVAAGLLFVDGGGLKQRLLGGSVAPSIRSLAVLPLRNLSGDAGQDYFADGITEALTTDLARMENLQIISATSAMQYKDAKKPLPVVARELKADVIVEGSVQRSGNEVRITAQLIRAATDQHLWAQTYSRDFSNILGLQDEIASSIGAQIQTRLGGPRPSTPPKVGAVNPEAYETYLRANSYFDDGQFSKSIDYYNQAVKLDPSYGPTYAHMAGAYFFLAFFGVLPPQEGWGNVKKMATLALEKDETIPEAHDALALALQHYDWDFAGAEREFKRALELNPSDADVRHYYAHYLMAMGRVAESFAESKHAVELDPVGDNLISCLCWHSFAARQYDDAVRLATQFLASQPDDPWEHTILGWTYEQKRMPDDAISQLQKAVDKTKSQSFFLASLGHAYAMAGRNSDAERVLQTLSERAKKSYVSAFDFATIYAGLGEKDKAFTWLDKAAAEHSSFLVYSKWEPRLDPLRSDPRFNQLLKRISLPE
jgi:serine/threonine protein kinase/Flp pilus assembly protein TadD